MTDSTDQELEPLEHSTSYEETQSWRTTPQPQPHLPRPLAPTLPPQRSRGSSTRSIPPSSSAHTSPSHLTHSSRPSRTRHQSRGSSTLNSPQPSTENGARAGSSRRPVSEKPRGENSRRPQREQQTPAQRRAPPRLPSLREEHRLCRRCAIVKPPRTHHCRACGTVRPRFLRG